ncbi:MAG: hypothetical protein U0Q22_08635 [Acidimicrobiales bacterium]
MTQPAPRPAPSRVAACVAVLVAVVMGASGCSDDAAQRDKAHDALAALGIKESPAEVVTVAVERADSASKLGAAFNTDYLHMRLAARGYSWTDAACAVTATVGVVGADVFGGLSIGDIENLKFRYPDADAAAKTCASPESAARLAVKQGSAAGPSAAPATDIDGATVRRTLTTAYRSSGKALGLTSAETDCVIAKVLTVHSDADFADIATGAKRILPSDTADEVVGCLTAKRVAALAPKAAESLVAQKEAADAEHQKVQNEIDAQIDALNASTTTVP